MPAVILSHGSGGVESNIYEVWVKELNAAGYAAFVADSYKPRGVRETNSNAEAAPYAVHLADTMNALRILATHPRIDNARIFNVGFSRGGSTAFDTAWPTWQRPIYTNGVKFAGHVAWYPGNCNIRHRTDDRERPTAPIFILLAEFEDGQDIAVCKRYYDELIAKGAPITYKVYQGARHGFDGLNFTYRINQKTTSGTNCDMEVFITLARGSGVGKNGFDFKKNVSIATDDDFLRSMKSCAVDGTAPGTRGGGRSKEAQAEGVNDVFEILKRWHVEK